MSDWTVGGEPCRLEAAGSPGTTSGGTTVTAAGSTNTKGAWAQLVASSAREAGGVLVAVRSVLTAADCLLDIGVGGAGSEQLLMKDLFIGNGSGFRHSMLFFAPISIPAGTRVAARQQCSVASQALGVSVHLLGSRFNQGKPLAYVDAIGTVSATTTLTTITANAAANTKGSYAQLIAATAREYRGVAIMTNVIATAARYGIDLAVGAAAAEQIIVPDFHVIPSTGSARANPTQMVFIPCRIPVGSRLSARCQSSTGGATIAAAAYGIG